MRLKPSPMNEASIIFSITWVFTFIAFALFTGDFDQALRASSISIVFLIISYVLWILTGYWWRKKGPQARFFMNVTVSSAVSIGALLLMNNAVTASTLDTEVKTNASGYFIAVAIVFFFTSVIAAALTQFLVVKPKKAKI
jgi:membrane protease YdiL (CAAX protease family)